LGVDIGGSTIRAGLVLLSWHGGALAVAQVANSWPYRDAEPGRDEAACR
ncbi:ROK family protein, partial [Lacticaseibacillus rhamnosus]